MGISKFFHIVYWEAEYGGCYGGNQNRQQWGWNDCNTLWKSGSNQIPKDQNRERDSCDDAGVVMALAIAGCDGLLQCGWEAQQIL